MILKKICRPRNAFQAFVALAFAHCLYWVPTAYAIEPKVTVTPFASVTAIEPGQPFEVAFQIEIEKAWHTYWKNSGDAGLPPDVRWKLPPGFDASPLDHPAPKRHVDRGGIVTFVHEDRPILIATLTPPEGLPRGGTVELTGEMALLVCKLQCIRLSRAFKLSLPVAGAARDASPANEKVFERARRSFPEPANQAKYAKIKPVIDVDKIRAGEKFKLGLVVEVEKGYHIQSHTPLAVNYIATDVFLEPTEDVLFERGTYPEHKVRTLRGNVQVAEYTGRLVVQFNGEADKALAGDSVHFAGVVRYQACNDAGICFLPQNIQWALDVPVAREGEPTKKVSQEYFSAAAPSSDSADESAKAIILGLGDSLGSKTLPVAPQGKGLPSLPHADSSSLKPVSPAVGSKLPASLDKGEVVPDAAAPADTAHDAQDEQDSAASNDIEDFLSRFGVVGLLAGCLLYGLFLNATPCVLPLLSIKVLGFVQQAHESRRRTLALGLAFGAGVVLFFIVLGFVAAAGKNMLQYPAVVIGLGAVVMALALSMLGVYTLKAPDTAAKLEANLQREGMLSSFGKGALAPILGFACTGPLLAAAFGWATQQAPHIAVLAFLAAGLGMAAPYMLLGANPNWLSFIPKPGPWMITFERIMGFLLLGMVVWLLDPLVTQIGATGFEWTLAFLVVIAMGCWLLGKVDMTMPSAQRWRYRGGALVLVAVSAVLVYGVFYPLGEAVAKQRALISASYAGSGGWESDIPWRLWSEQEVEDTVRSGRTVFVDFTAAWCTVCKVNKKVAVDTPEARRKMQELGIVPFRGDFSTGDADIAAVLKKHSRAGVPLNLIYPADKPDSPIVLRPNLTKSYLLGKLDEAGASSASLVSRPALP